MFICGGQLWVTRAPPSYHRRHSSERTPTTGERERGGERKSVILSSQAGICARTTTTLTLTLQHRRARYSIPNTWRVRRVLTGITAMMWYHSQPWPDRCSALFRRPCDASRAARVCSFLVFNTTMHNALAICSQLEEKKKGYDRSDDCFWWMKTRGRLEGNWTGDFILI